MSDFTTSVSGGNRWLNYLRQKFARQKPPTVRVGILEGSTYSQDHYTNTVVTKTMRNGRKKKVAKARTPRTNLPKIVEVAFWNEFGTVKSPQRSFLRSTLDDKSQDWAAALGKLIRRMTLEQALEQLGRRMVNDVIRTIKAGVAPELSQFTLDMRKVNKIQGTKPLMASREMITALASEVKN